MVGQILDIIKNEKIFFYKLLFLYILPNIVTWQFPPNFQLHIITQQLPAG